MSLFSSNLQNLCGIKVASHHRLGCKNNIFVSCKGEDFGCRLWRKRAQVILPFSLWFWAQYFYSFNEGCIKKLYERNPLRGARHIHSPSECAFFVTVDWTHANLATTLAHALGPAPFNYGSVHFQGVRKTKSLPSLATSCPLNTRLWKEKPIRKLEPKLIFFFSWKNRTSHKVKLLTLNVITKRFEGLLLTSIQIYIIEIC